MHLLYYGDHGVLDIHGLPTFITFALLAGAVAGWAALIYVLGSQRYRIGLEGRVSALELQLAAVAARRSD